MPKPTVQHMQLDTELQLLALTSTARQTQRIIISVSSCLVTALEQI
jgi:hypothetical protein